MYIYLQRIKQVSQTQAHHYIYITLAKNQSDYITL